MFKGFATQKQVSLEGKVGSGTSWTDLEREPGLGECGIIVCFAVGLVSEDGLGKAGGRPFLGKHNSHYQGTSK